MADIDAMIASHRATRRKYEGDDGEVESNEGVHCPSCGHFHDDPSDLQESCVYSEGEHDFTCVECGADFKVETKIEFTWVTKPLETES